jgi:hypothetical protein
VNDTLIVKLIRFIKLVGSGRSRLVFHVFFSMTLWFRVKSVNFNITRRVSKVTLYVTEGMFGIILSFLFCWSFWSSDRHLEGEMVLRKLRSAYDSLIYF